MTYLITHVSASVHTPHISIRHEESYSDTLPTAPIAHPYKYGYMLLSAHCCLCRVAFMSYISLVRAAGALWTHATSLVDGADRRWVQQAPETRSAYMTYTPRPTGHTRTHKCKTETHGSIPAANDIVLAMDLGVCCLHTGRAEALQHPHSRWGAHIQQRGVHKRTRGDVWRS